MNEAAWHTSLDNNEIIFIIVTSGLAGLVLLFLTFYFLKRARVIEDTPTSKIRSAAQGYVELVGAVSTGESGSLIAPLSGTPCVWYHFKVQKYRRSVQNSHWHTIRKGTSEHWFEINDKTGTCVIDPQGAKVMTAHKRTWYGHSEFPEQQTTNTPSLFEKIRGRRYRYIEQFIYIHDVIHALGNFQSQGGGRNLPSNHQITGDVIREWKQDYDKILQQFDRDGNGEIDMQEWEEVRKAARQEAEKRRGQLSEQPTVHILSKTPNSKRYPFILSNHSQQHLAKRFRYYAFSAFSGTAICCYLFITLAF